MIPYKGDTLQALPRQELLEHFSLTKCFLKKIPNLPHRDADAVWATWIQMKTMESVNAQARGCFLLSEVNQNYSSLTHSKPPHIHRRKQSCSLSLWGAHSPGGIGKLTPCSLLQQSPIGTFRTQLSHFSEPWFGAPLVSPEVSLSVSSSFKATSWTPYGTTVTATPSSFLKLAAQPQILRGLFVF